MNYKNFLQALSFFLTPFIGIYLIELSIRGNHALAIEWIKANFSIYLVSIIIILILLSLLLSITNNIPLAILISFIVLLLFLQINKYKLQFLNEPLLPWDLFFANQVKDLLPVLYQSINLSQLTISGIVIIILILIIIKFTRFNLINWPRRLILFFFTIITLIAISNYPNNFFNKYIVNSGGTLISWDQKSNQITNGFVLGFVLNMPSVMINEPSRYTKDNINKIISDININSKNNYETSKVKPNIVIIMSEAFWELNNLDLQYEGSTTPTVDKYKIGSLISPSFGGGTANVEFEVLTGFSMNNLPGGSVPYQQYLKKNTPSMASILAEQGYETTAIHTYYKYFWSRDTVYKNIGFNKFIALEDLIEQEKFGEFYIDDAEVNRLILTELKENQDPSFIYAITMQNHGPYLDSRYGSETINLASSYSSDSNQIINTYGTGIMHSDKMLESLMNDIEKTEEPTLVVFFGDHLPALWNVYTELGFVKDMNNKTLTEELKMKKTPLVVWNNYGKEIQPINLISASFLSPKIMEWAELESPAYYHFLHYFHSKMPAYTSLIKYSEEGDLTRETPNYMKELEESYQLIQYDLMFGQNYSRNKLYELNNKIN